MEHATAKRANGSRADQASDETLPRDYAAINAVWVALAAGLVTATRGRASEDPIEARELIPMAAATFALSKAVARERIGTWVREPFVEEEDGGRRLRGGPLRHAIGELVTCTRCVDTWSALAVVGLRVAKPEAGRTITTVLATSAASDWLQAGFRWLCQAANS